MGESLRGFRQKACTCVSGLPLPEGRLERTAAAKIGDPTETAPVGHGSVGCYRTYVAKLTLSIDDREAVRETARRLCVGDGGNVSRRGGGVGRPRCSDSAFGPRSSQKGGYRRLPETSRGEI